jgi:pimeloyl-ACP methyl ester carboxylesterase
MKKNLLLLLTICICRIVMSQPVAYPSIVDFFHINIEWNKVEMAYMDIPPATTANGETILLLHGKNFNGYYWKEIIPMFTNNGYRLIIPDQVGWGKSDKPNLHYSFHLLALNTKKLLDSLHISKVHVIGHSMGGMLASRFSLLFPDKVVKLILENPIGLEDYRTFIPYQPVEFQYEKERKATYDSYKKYQQTYYMSWKPEFEQYVVAQWAPFNTRDSTRIATANALTWQMIYEQPVIYELKNIKVPTLLIIGTEDKTVFGKDRLSKEAADEHAKYYQLAVEVQKQIKNSKLVEIKGTGHIPHIEARDIFVEHVLAFLRG